MINFRPFAAATIVMMLAPIANAQQTDAQTTDRISVELNSAKQIDEACQLSFVLQNGLDAAASTLVFETVLFTKQGTVDRLSLFDMRDIPAGATRVRQFNVPSLACDSLGKVLINGIADCQITGVQDCAQVLDYSSRTEVEIIR